MRLSLYDCGTLWEMPSALQYLLKFRVLARGAMGLSAVVILVFPYHTHLLILVLWWLNTIVGFSF